MSRYKTCTPKMVRRSPRKLHRKLNSNCSDLKIYTCHTTKLAEFSKLTLKIKKNEPWEPLAQKLLCGKCGSIQKLRPRRNQYFNVLALKKQLGCYMDHSSTSICHTKSKSKFLILHNNLISCKTKHLVNLHYL
jgi:hypothetical protein